MGDALSWVIQIIEADPMVMSVLSYLETLQSYDKLEVKVERLVRDVLVQKALKNNFRYKL